MDSKPGTIVYKNYDGPGLGWVAMGDRMLPLSDPEAIRALAESAMLLSLGCSQEAKEYREIIEAGRRERGYY